MRDTLTKERNKKKTPIKSVAVDFFNGSTVGKIGKNAFFRVCFEKLQYR